MRNHRLRRCCLSVPGSREDMLEKARQIEIDQIVIDWEDAVALIKSRRRGCYARARRPLEGIRSLSPH